MYTLKLNLNFSLSLWFAVFGFLSLSLVASHVRACLHTRRRLCFASLCAPSRDNSREGYISVYGMDRPVLVQGALMNRAVDGDVVCVEILDESQWTKATGWWRV